jgi:hypothetical protein
MTHVWHWLNGAPRCRSALNRKGEPCEIVVPRSSNGNIAVRFADGTIVIAPRPAPPRRPPPPMTRDELIALAAPACPECGQPIQRTEIHYQISATADAPTYTPIAAMICPDSHRTPVPPPDA